VKQTDRQHTSVSAFPAPLKLRPQIAIQICLLLLISSYQCSCLH